MQTSDHAQLALQSLLGTSKKYGQVALLVPVAPGEHAPSPAQAPTDHEQVVAEQVSTSVPHLPQPTVRVAPGVQIEVAGQTHVPAVVLHDKGLAHAPPRVPQLIVAPQPSGTVPQTREPQEPDGAQPHTPAVPAPPQVSGEAQPHVRVPVPQPLSSVPHLPAGQVVAGTQVVSHLLVVVLQVFPPVQLGHANVPPHPSGTLPHSSPVGQVPIGLQTQECEVTSHVLSVEHPGQSIVPLQPFESAPHAVAGHVIGVQVSAASASAPTSESLPPSNASAPSVAAESLASAPESRASELVSAASLPVLVSVVASGSTQGSLSLHPVG